MQVCDLCIHIIISGGRTSPEILPPLSALLCFILIRCHRSHLPELAEEIFLVVISAFISDSRKTHRRCQKQVFCVCDTALYKILMKAYTEKVFVSAAEISAAVVHLTAEFLGCPRLFRRRVDLVPDRSVSAESCI